MPMTGWKSEELAKDRHCRRAEDRIHATRRHASQAGDHLGRPPGRRVAASGCVGVWHIESRNRLRVREAGRDRRDDRSGPRQRLRLSSRLEAARRSVKARPNGLSQIAFARDANLVGPMAQPPVIDLSGEVIGDARDG